MVAEVVLPTLAVVTVKVALVCPSGMTTLSGGVADALLELKKTATPPAGAGMFKVAVPVEDVPPFTDDGLRVTEERPTVWTTWQVPSAPQVPPCGQPHAIVQPGRCRQRTRRRPVKRGRRRPR